MFYATKSKRKSRKSAPCECGDICPCHKPSKDITLFQVMAMMMGFGVVLMFLGYLASKATSSPSLIEVDGKMCEVHFKKSGITSTGASVGHNVAVCK